MLPYAAALDELLVSLSVNPAAGLDASQATQRLAQTGPNRLREKKKKTLPQRFIDQFKDVMILILIAAALVSFGVSVYEGNASEFYEPALIMAIVILNAVMGLVQESRAEKSLEALKKLSAPRARVLRNGQEQIIDAAELVPGDVILLAAGDFVPADARLVRAANLRTEESALTGESVPAEKDAAAVVAENAPLGDRRNMVYTGCGVTYGSGTAVVTATGMDTEIGRIAELLDAEGEGQTPLQARLAKLGSLLGLVALGVCAAIFAIGLWEGMHILEIFMIAVSLAVSAIPEGLPAIVTIVLSIGVQRMVRRNAIIRRLPAVETLGSASVICSDKTGTLTQNRMTLVRAYCGGEEEISDANGEAVRRLLQYATLCCDASLRVEGERVEHIGDPTESAIVYAAYRNGLHKEDLNRASPRLTELPFDSGRKLMTTVHEIDGQIVAIVKGAFDVLARRCVGGGAEEARAYNDAMGSQALRVLAVAWRTLDAVPKHPAPEELEDGLQFMGLVGMIDPPRPEVRDAVAVCREAGIRPVMITGDHVNTAAAIAGELGILREGDAAISGPELAVLSEEELDRRLSSIVVYARVSPEDKIRIVKAWQKRDAVVAMTGDGVNDAPALKAADIGCAMGITGTDVAKSAADMTLTDDNFATIVSAVREGRGIYENIRKVVGFLLGTNIGEILTVLGAMILWREAPLLSMQLLWINLVTDGLPAIALGMEAVESDVMRRAPKPKNEGIFAHGLGLRVMLQGLLFGSLSLLSFHLGLRLDGTVETARTMTFLTLALAQIVQAYNMRSARSLFAIGPFGNRNLNLAALTSTILIALVMFTPLRGPFSLDFIPAAGYWQAAALAFIPLPVMELAKIGERGMRGFFEKKPGKKL